MRHHDRYGKTRLRNWLREHGAEGTVLASPNKWEQRQADGSWKEIERPEIVGRKATLIVVDDVLGGE